MWHDPPCPYRKCAAIVGVLVLIALARAPVTWVAYVIPGSSAVVWDWIHRSRMQDGGVFRYGSIVHPEVTCYLEARHPNYSSVLDVACNHGIMLRRLQRSRPHAKFFGADVSEVMVNATRKRCPTCVVAQMNLADLLHERDARAPVKMRLTHSLTCVLLLTDHTNARARLVSQLLPAPLPSVVDVVIVSDVLYYSASLALSKALWLSVPPGPHRHSVVVPQFPSAAGHPD